MTLDKFRGELDRIAGLPPGERLVELIGLFKRLLLERFSGRTLGSDGGHGVTASEVADFLRPFHEAYLAHPTLLAGVSITPHDGRTQ